MVFPFITHKEPGYVFNFSLKNDIDFQINPACIAMGNIIGKGQFGKVYRGEWRGTAVAVKIIDMLPEMKSSRYAGILKTC